MKKVEKEVKWRKIHLYMCIKCNNKRMSFKYWRAKGKMCVKCQRHFINPNQGKLFKSD